MLIVVTHNSSAHIRQATNQKQLVNLIYFQKIEFSSRLLILAQYIFLCHLWHVWCGIDNHNR